jgi:dihydrodipicolinate synthase/N-acetylneuraminate lyase
LDISQAKQLFRGLMIPVITNFNNDLTIDAAAIRQNVDYLIEHGIVTGQGVLLAVGAGGDFNMLDPTERKLAAHTIVEAVGGRVPVIVGAQDTNVNVMIEMARYAESIGAEGIQISTPYYYRPSDDDALRVYRAIHDATSTIAIMAYNTFWHAYDFPFSVLDQLCELERIVSLKWARPDNGTPYMRGLARYADRLAVVDNGGMAVMNHMMGGTGYITHLATVWPECDLGIWKQLEAGKYRVAQERIMETMWPWRDFRGKMARRISGEAPPVRAALELVGRPGGPSRLPARALNSEERNDLRLLLQQIGVPNVQ